MQFDVKPYSVILLDEEVEKAHLKISLISYYKFSDGRLTDGGGGTVDFRNTVIIMTSNLGAKHYIRLWGVGFGTKKQNLILMILKKIDFNDIQGGLFWMQ